MATVPNGYVDDIHVCKSNEDTLRRCEDTPHSLEMPKQLMSSASLKEIGAVENSAHTPSTGLSVPTCGLCFLWFNFYAN